MKSLAIDCAVSKIAVAAKNENVQTKLVLDVGVKQSEKLLPAIDYVMREVSLLPKDLAYIAVTLGPGSFTGLRLGLSTAKAIQLASNVPVYGIPSLEAFAFPYKNLSVGVLSLIEAKENEFFCAFYKNGSEILGASDVRFEDIIQKLTHEDEIVAVGPGSKAFLHLVHTKETVAPLFRNIVPEIDACESLFALAEIKIQQNKDALADFDGPLYIRKSEAEIVREKKEAEKSEGST